MVELTPGMKAYTKNLSLHINNTEFIFTAPRGKKFAVILMTDEKPDNDTGILADQWLNEMGWDFSNE